MDWKSFFHLKPASSSPATTAASGDTSTTGAPASTPASTATAGTTPEGGSTESTSATSSTVSAPATAAAPPAPPAKPPSTVLSQLNSQSPGTQGGTDTSALNSQIVQAVQLTNSETAAYAASQTATAPNMMITQASGLVAQSGAGYFDSASKLAIASKSVLMKNMTEKLAQENIKGAAEDALGILITDLLVGTAAAVAAAAGAVEGEAAHFALDKIDQSLSKYNSLAKNL